MVQPIVMQVTSPTNSERAPTSKKKRGGEGDSKYATAIHTSRTEDGAEIRETLDSSQRPAVCVRLECASVLVEVRLSRM